ncbi:uncharacterized protein LOC135685991 [Rhopilema esculentum]|uniref:uncharacterized protein LOC135685991 n=1 Tax=Rhopilema esculentum TaxID=499914 RepID=UPI0031D5F3A2
MTHILVDRGYPANIRPRLEKVNHQYLRGLDELRRRHRKGGITPQEFEEIRASSRQSWTSECEDQDPSRSGFQTTYSSFHHYRKEPECDGAKYRSKSRPTSPHRKHRPHPQRKYITLEMKEAPGFQNSFASNSKHQEPYTVGKPYEKDDIYTEKKLYYSTPTYDELKAQELVYHTKPEADVSLHRWLKKSGVEEKEISQRRRYKLSKDLKIPAETNSRYLGKLSPQRYILGKYGS